MDRKHFAAFRDFVYEDVFEKHEEDPVQHLLVITYEYDEQQLLNLLCGRELHEEFQPRQSHLKWLADIRPVVIHDARKTREGSRIPQFVEVHPYKTRAFSCHHSKAYLIVTRKTVWLALGSFNLTMTGLFRNREVFEMFEWAEDRYENATVLREFVGFLRDNYVSRLGESSQSALQNIVKTLEQRLAMVRSPETTPQSGMGLLTSGYAAAGLETLRVLWDRAYPGSEPVCAFTASPFFDENPANSCLARALKKSFPRLAHLDLVTDQHVEKMLSQAHFGGIEKCGLHLIPEDVTPEEQERVSAYARSKGISSRDQIIKRKLHAKLLMLYNEGNAIVYMGSANFTEKAWLGRNRELGLVWHQRDPAAFVELIKKCLSAGQRNEYSALPGLPPAKVEVEDPEAYDEEVGKVFPDFLETIVLELAEDGRALQFRFETGERNEPQTRTLADYRIMWGSTALRVEGEYSESLPFDQYSRLLASGRNLKFVLLSDSTKSYYFPFQYSGQVVAERHTLIHGTSWDWLDFYLNPDKGDPPGEGEFVPGVTQPEVDPVGDACAVGREKNPVIAMQGYLNLFTRIERDFAGRLESAEHADADEYRKAIDSIVVDPLRVYHSLLAREGAGCAADRAGGLVEPGYVFKMGELLLFLKSLKSKLRPGHGDVFAGLIIEVDKTLVDWDDGKNPRCRYVRFAHSQAGT